VSVTEPVRKPRIAVIDYGIGNLRSAEKAVQRAGADAFLTSDPTTIDTADGVVLPGVGAMGRCMESLDQFGLRQAVLTAVASGRPFLGVCVGMQMLHRGSTEHGGVEGLGVFDATVREIRPAPDDGEVLKVPHMQWNQLELRAESLLINKADDHWVYFVHSFAADVHQHVVSTVDYGGPITAVVERGSVMGTQFHPEKSGLHGQRILRSFVAMCAS
jgi:imidazole glycerol-phosphate synthase subunit HisH